MSQFLIDFPNIGHICVEFYQKNIEANIAYMHKHTHI